MESRWGRVSRSGFPSSARQFYRPPIKHRARLQQQAQRHYCQRWEARLRAETTLMMGWISECLGMGTRGHLNHLLYRRRKPGGEQPLSRTVYVYHASETAGDSIRSATVNEKPLEERVVTFYARGCFTICHLIELTDRTLNRQ